MKRYINKLKKTAHRYLLSRIVPRYIVNYRNNGKINFIDVGSVGGLPEPWRYQADHVKFLLNFEPNDSPKHRKHFMTYNTAVWEAEETLPFYIYKGINATGSSLFEQNVEYVTENYEKLKTRGPKYLAETWFERSVLVKTVKLQCRTLDNILGDEFPNRKFHFIKIYSSHSRIHINQFD